MGCAKTTITVRQSRSIEDQEIGKQFSPVWKSVQLKILFPHGDDEGALSSQRSTPVHKSSASTIAETAWEKPVFKLALSGKGQVFALTAPDLHFLGTLDDMKHSQTPKLSSKKEKADSSQALTQDT